MKTENHTDITNLVPRAQKHRHKKKKGSRFTIRILLAIGLFIIGGASTLFLQPFVSADLFPPTTQSSSEVDIANTRVHAAAHLQRPDSQDRTHTILIDRFSNADEEAVGDVDEAESDNEEELIQENIMSGDENQREEHTPSPSSSNTKNNTYEKNNIETTQSNDKSLLTNEENKQEDTTKDISAKNVVDHTVQPKETLYSITMKYYLGSHYQEKVATFNKLTDASELKAGMTLKLPDPPIINYHTVTVDDTLYSLSKQYYGTGNYVANLAMYNDIIEPSSDFERGMELIIPNSSLYEGFTVQINKSTNRLVVYHNNELVRAFDVATGKGQSLTPEGIFQIANKVEDPWYNPSQIPGGDPSNPLGSRWLGLNVPGTNGTIYGIHGTNDSSSIGKYISLGCVRMYNEDVEWLYNTLPVQTPVYIYSD